MENSPILIISGTNRPGSNAMRVSNILLKHYQSQQKQASIFSLTDLPKEISKAPPTPPNPPQW